MNDSINTSTDADLSLFDNVQSYAYWSGTEYAPSTANAWGFGTDYGNQDVAPKTKEFYAWAVRSGDVAAATVPEPGTMLLLAAGLIGVASTKQRRCL